MNLYKAGLKNTLYNYLGLIFSVVFSFLVVVILSRNLSVEEFGIYNILLSFLAYISVVSSLGMPHVLRRYIPQFYEQGSYSAVKRSLSYVLALRFITSFICAVLCLVFIEPLSQLLKVSQLSQFFFLFSFAMLVVVQVQSLEVALEAMLLHKSTNIIKAAYAMLQFLLYFYAIRSGYGLKGIILVYLVVNILLFIAYLFVCKSKIFTLPQDKVPDGVPYKRIRSYALFNWFTNATYIIFDFKTDFFIISFFLGSSFVGLYSFATSTITQIYRLLPITIAATVLFPIMVRKYSRSKDKEELQYLFRLYNKMVFFFGFPLAIGVLVLGDKIISYVFDPKYLGVVNLFRFIAFAQVINMFSTALAYFVKILEKVHYALWARVFVIYNIAMEIILLKFFGLMGVAFATGTAWLFNSIFVFFLLRRDIVLIYPGKSFMQIAVNSILMGIVLFLCRGLAYNIWGLALLAIAGVVFYLTANCFNRAFEARDLQVFNKMAGAQIFK
ncbi:MAG: oligosaccharide flippase family protein [Candidatus Omnitrophica bacterium]|nr:oligosaccharide flippase family protein [Candidatus Omnitrophota bacterium]